MRVDVEHRPVYTLRVSGNEDEMLAKIQDFLLELDILDNKNQIWHELCYAINGEPDCEVRAGSFCELAEIINNIKDLGILL